MLSTQMIHSVVEWERRLKLDGGKRSNHNSAQSADPNRFEMYLDSERATNPAEIQEEAYCCGSLSTMCSSDCFTAIVQDAAV